ncbi:MAG: hypothetical protein JWM80_4295 [Cyanobacteria bacterium RYN_339]|nr:hypothetical protein [Cyanobacteria bacterium RYN_339]
MRRTLPLILLLLAACKVDPAVRPAVRASAGPASAASASPKPVSVADRLLKRGDAAARNVSGTIMVDAGYIVAQGGGNVLTVGGQQVLGLITNDGGSLITNDGGSIVAQGGGNIVAQGGGNIVAQGGGNLITNDGGSLITNDGGSLLTDDGTSFVANGIVAQGGGNIVAQGGGNIVAQGGGNIVAQGGGNIVAQGGGNYRLEAVPAPGTQLPAVGMVISVVSLDTHKYLPLGRNLAGKPVYSVFSDAKGAYTIYPEAAKDENVVVVASAPGTKDRHRSYNVIAPAGSDEAVRMAEDTSLTTKLLRVIFASQLKRLTQDTTEPGVPRCTPTAAEKQLVALLTPEYVDKLRRASLAGRAYALDEVAAEQLSLEAADILITKLDLPNTPTAPLLTRSVGIPAEALDLKPEPVMQAMTAILGLLRDATPKTLAADPNAFSCGGSNAEKLSDACRFISFYGLPELKVDTPISLADYCVNKLLWAGDPTAVDRIGDLMDVAGVDKPRRQLFRLLGVTTGVEIALAGRLGEGDFKDRILATITTAKDRLHRAGVADPTPLPSGTCAPDRRSPLDKVLN